MKSLLALAHQLFWTTLKKNNLWRSQLSRRLDPLFFVDIFSNVTVPAELLRLNQKRQMYLCVQTILDW